MESRDTRISEIGKAFAGALLAGDEIAAELAIRDAIDSELTTAVIDDEIIAPALWLVGDLWERGEISVADEHLATEISVRVLTLQREAERTAAGRAGHRVMLSATAGEMHVVALRMTGNLLRDAGYDVIMLGADVPPEALAAAAVRHEPEVICVTATMPGGSDQALIAIHEVQRVYAGALFVVGGRDVSGRLRSRPGIAICERVGEAVQSVDAMVKRADLN